MNLSPTSILADAQKSVPAVKYASGVAGVASVVAIIAGFQLDYRIAVFGTLLVLGLMFLLVIFSAFVAHSGPSIIVLATCAAWSFLLLTVSASTFLMTSYFFAWPRTLDSYVDIGRSQDPIDLDSDDESSDPVNIFSASGYANLVSEQGDYIGQGAELEFSDENGLFSVQSDLNSISLFFEGDDYWSFVFSAPRGETLGIGEYSSAQRAAFHNPVFPGIEVSGAGRGCNEVSGRFFVHEVGVTAQRTLERFVAEFEQQCDGERSMLKGEIDVSVID